MRNFILLFLLLNWFIFSEDILFQDVVTGDLVRFSPTEHSLYVVKADGYLSLNYLSGEYPFFYFYIYNTELLVIIQILNNQEAYMYMANGLSILVFKQATIKMNESPYLYDDTD